jgi:hypothetical protein
MISCLYCGQHAADFCIPEFQRWAFEIYWFESADFQMSPSDIRIELNMLLAILKFQKGAPKNHQLLNCKAI